MYSSSFAERKLILSFSKYLFYYYYVTLEECASSLTLHTIVHTMSLGCDYIRGSGFSFPQMMTSREALLTESKVKHLRTIVPNCIL